MGLELIGDSAAGRSRWTATAGPRLFGFALTNSPEFWEHVRILRREPLELETIARRYVRRDRGERLLIMRSVLIQAARCDDDTGVKIHLWGLAPVAYWVNGAVDSGQPQRLLRHDAADALIRAAVSVARLGAERCTRLECADFRGAQLQRDNTEERCVSCRDEYAERSVRRAEGRLFAQVRPFMLDEFDDYE